VEVVVGIAHRAAPRHLRTTGRFHCLDERSCSSAPGFPEPFISSRLQPLWGAEGETVDGTPGTPDTRLRQIDETADGDVIDSVGDRGHWL
jgi:hypothetical protein